MHYDGRTMVLVYECLGRAMLRRSEKYPGNPILVDLPGNIGLGHADRVVIDGRTVLYTALQPDQRSRLDLIWPLALTIL